MAKIIAATLALLLLGACAAPAAQLAEKRLELTEYEYKPASMEMAAGESVKLVLVNTGVIEHDFTIDSIGFKAVVRQGGTVERTFGPLAAGTYDVYCSIPGHKELGMVMTLEVK